MTRKTIVIEYDPNQDRHPLEPGETHEDLDLFAYLRNELDNAKIKCELREFDAPASAASYLSDEVFETVARLERLQDAVSAFESGFKDKLLNPMLYPEPPEWLCPLTAALHTALAASKVQS